MSLFAPAAKVPAVQPLIVCAGRGRGGLHSSDHDHACTAPQQHNLQAHAVRGQCCWPDSVRPRAARLEWRARRVLQIGEGIGRTATAHDTRLLIALLIIVGQRAASLYQVEQSLRRTGKQALFRPGYRSQLIFLRRSKGTHNTAATRPCEAQSVKRSCTYPILVAGASHAFRFLAHADIFALVVSLVFGCEHALVDSTVALQKERPHESIVATHRNN